MWCEGINRSEKDRQTDRQTYGLTHLLLLYVPLLVAELEQGEEEEEEEEEEQGEGGGGGYIFGKCGLTQ